MEKKWIINKIDDDKYKEIKDKYGFSDTVSRILAGRDLKNVNDIKNFLNPSFGCFKDPNKLKDVLKGCERLFKSLKNKEKIVIFGDYDADGITSTVILLEFLKYSDANISYFIPHRKIDGYGLKKEFVINTDADLIITVDNGVTSHEAVSCAKERGIDVIITDHHDVSGTLPEAYAVINPKRNDCNSGLEHLAGVGVTYCFIIVLRQFLRRKGFYLHKDEPNLKQYCDMVAIGTVADLVPMIEENRVLVKTGFDVISSTKRPGLIALLKYCNINHRIENSDDIGFKLAPKINAAGRMDHGKICVELFTTNNRNNADLIAKKLLNLNLQRQKVERQTEKEILSILEKEDSEFKNVCILSSSKWDSGILGIVASKIVSKIYRPVVLFEQNGILSKGSGRSISLINMHDAFTDLKDIIENFGGHAMAAGLSIKTENIKRFRELFDRYAGDIIKDEIPKPTIKIDCPLELDNINLELMDELELIEPCGILNSSPVFIAENIEIVKCTTIGKNHKKLSIIQKNGLDSSIFNAIVFNDDIINSEISALRSIVYSPQWNQWNGKKSLQIVIDDYRL